MLCLDAFTLLRPVIREESKLGIADFLRKLLYG